MTAMYRVLAYDADGFTWSCVYAHGNRERARTAAFVAKQDRAFQWVALVLVRIAVADGATEIELVECNAPSAERLLNVVEFRTAATAKTAKL
jgi:hypothetical protein